jgi:hypothetical protein
MCERQLQVHALGMYAPPAVGEMPQQQRHPHVDVLELLYRELEAQQPGAANGSRE